MVANIPPLKKEMVRDILQTEEGKNALREALKDPGMRKSLYLQETEAKATIRETLLSPEGTQLLQKRPFTTRHLWQRSRLNNKQSS